MTVRRRDDAAPCDARVQRLCDEDGPEDGTGMYRSASPLTASVRR